MTLNQAIKILMECAIRDVTGAGQGYRSTTDEWRGKVAKAWVVAFRRIHTFEPCDSDYFNAHMERTDTRLGHGDKVTENSK